MTISSKQHDVHKINDEYKFIQTELMNYLLITSAKEVTFLPLCVCLSVSRITQKVVDKF